VVASEVEQVCGCHLEERRVEELSLVGRLGHCQCRAEPAQIPEIWKSPYLIADVGAVAGVGS
jgi:hypothetical protein